MKSISIVKKSSASPTVSVIIPTYNHAHFLTQAVRSVFDQTFQDFEIVVVDDGSTDNTREVVQTYTDSRFKYIYQENKGLAASRNTGLRAARGEFVAFLDADDIFLPCKLEVQLEWFENHPSCGMVVSGYYFMNDQGEFVRANTPWISVPILEVEDWLFNCPVVPNAVLVKKHWIDQVGGFDEVFRRVEDWDLWLRLAYAGCKIEWVKEIVCGYRFSPGQMTRNAAAQKRVSVQMMDKFYKTPNLSNSFKNIKSDVYSRLYVVCAGREYGARQFEDAKESIAHALKLTPDLLGSRQSELVDELLSWAHNPFVGDHLDYTRCVFDNLPDEADEIRSKKNWALGEIGLRTLYENYQNKNWSEVRRAGLTLAANAPHRLLNRGVLSILWQSLKN